METEAISADAVATESETPLIEELTEDDRAVRAAADELAELEILELTDDDSSAI